MNNPNVLVIGNGFDLYHGLKTNYMDFVKFAVELSKSVKGTKGRKYALNNIFIQSFIKVASENQSWIDCEKEIEIIITMILKILYDRNVFNNNSIVITKDKSSLYSYEFERLRLINKFCEKSTSQTIIFSEKYFKVYQGIDKSLIMDTLKRDLNDLIELFKYYLEENVLNQSIEKLSKQIESINPDYIINFNYTNTYEQYGINRQNVCYIHGSVQDSNMVLGIRDIDEKDINSIYFKKFFQRIQKHTDTIQWDKFKSIVSTRPIRFREDGEWYENVKYNKAFTYFFGHSLSNTDGDLIRNIYENSEAIMIFYLEKPDYKDYERKVINLIDTLGKEIVIQGMYSRKIVFIPIE